MTSITATNITSQQDTLLKTLWSLAARTTSATNTVTIINNSDIAYDINTDKFTFTYNDALASALFYNVTPKVVFTLSFILNWRIYNTGNSLRVAWGDSTRRYEIEFSILAESALSTFAPTTIRLKYANKTNIYQVVSVTSNSIYTNTNHLCVVSCDDESNIELSIDGVTIFSINELDVLNPENGWKLINTNDPMVLGNFGFEYYRNTILRTGATVQGSLDISEITIKNYNYFADDVLVAGNISAITYENLERQPIISGMYDKLYNNLTHTKMSLTYNNYSVIRQYPPVRSFTANTYSISGQSYGNGTYIISSANAEESSTFSPFKAIDGDLTTSFSPNDRGVFTNGVYTGVPWSVMMESTGLLQEYKGVEITLQLPAAILLDRAYVRFTNTGVSSYAILASSDGVSWTEVMIRTNVTLSADTLYFLYSSAFAIPYKYYKVVILGVIATGVVKPRIVEYYLLGQDYSVNTFFTASNNRVECSTLKATKYENLENQSIIQTLQTNASRWDLNATTNNLTYTGDVSISGNLTLKGGIPFGLTNTGNTYLPYTDNVNYIRGPLVMCDTGGAVKVGDTVYSGLSKFNINQGVSGTYNVGTESSGHGLFISDQYKGQSMCFGCDTVNTCCYMAANGNLVIQPSPTSGTQRLGIGTIPSFKLDVYRGFTGSSGTVCRIFGTDNGIPGERGIRVAQKVAADDWKPLSVFNNGIEVVTVRNANVGISNQNPQQKLDVAGIIKSEGLLIGNKTIKKTYFVQVTASGGWTLSRNFYRLTVPFTISDAFGVTSVDTFNYMVFVSVTGNDFYGLTSRVTKQTNAFSVTFDTQDSQQFYLFNGAVLTYYNLAADVFVVMFE